MFRNILVPLDGSRFAEAALPLATSFTGSAHGRLHLLMVHQPAVAMAGMGDVVAASAEIDEELREKELGYLTGVAAGLGPVGGTAVGSSVVDGAAGAAVIEEAARLSADLVVMATHGRGMMGRLWLGSVADYVVRHATTPVLLVRPVPGDSIRPERLPQRVLVPLDLSPESEQVVPAVVELAQLAQAHVTLLHVVEPFYYAGDPGQPFPMPQDATITELRCRDAQRRLDRTADRLRERGIGVSARVIVGSSAAAGILELLDERAFDLVALTTHGVGGLRRLLLGSVADKVIRGSARPVFLLRPRAVAAAR